MSQESTLNRGAFESSNWDDDDDWSIDDNTNRSMTASMEPDRMSEAEDTLQNLQEMMDAIEETRRMQAQWAEVSKILRKLRQRSPDDQATLETVLEEEEEEELDPECDITLTTSVDFEEPRFEQREAVQTQKDLTTVSWSLGQDRFESAGVEETSEKESGDDTPSQEAAKDTPKKRSYSHDEPRWNEGCSWRSDTIELCGVQPPVNQHPIPGSVPLQFSSSLPDDFDEHPKQHSG